MELKITKEKVLEAAEKCSEAKKILKTLFPIAFNDDINDDLIRPGLYDDANLVYYEGDPMISKNGLYSYGRTSLILWGNVYDWEIKNLPDRDHKLLIPTKK